MEVSRHWRLNEQRYTLKGSTCTGCGKRFFGPRPVCDECQPPVEVSQRQTVHPVRYEELETVFIAQR